MSTKQRYGVDIAWWTIAAMPHLLARGPFSFGAFRFLMKMGEAGNWPAASEWSQSGSSAGARAYVDPFKTACGGGEPGQRAYAPKVRTRAAGRNCRGWACPLLPYPFSDPHSRNRGQFTAAGRDPTGNRYCIRLVLRCGRSTVQPRQCLSASTLTNTIRTFVYASVYHIVGL